MDEVKSKIDVLSSKYIENYASMKKIILELESYFELSRSEGSKEKIKRARKRNKLLAREKIDLLLDENKPYVELMSLAGLKHENGFGAGGTTVVVLGYVSGILCLINANVATRKAGAIDYATSLKNLRLSQIASENELLTINLVESGGANLPDQDRVLIIMVDFLWKCLKDLKKEFRQFLWFLEMLLREEHMFLGCQIIQSCKKITQKYFLLDRP